MHVGTRLYRRWLAGRLPRRPESGLLKRYLYDHPQIVVPALRARLLHFAHAPVATAHQGGRKLYQTSAGIDLLAIDGPRLLSACA